jgi:hypothetical protein
MAHSSTSFTNAQKQLASHASMWDQTSIFTSLIIFFDQTGQRMSGAKVQAFSELHPRNLTSCQRAVCKARNCLAY